MPAANEIKWSVVGWKCMVGGSKVHTEFCRWNLFL